MSSFLIDKLKLFISWIPIIFYLANLLLLFGHSGLPYSIVTLMGGILGLFIMIKNHNKRCHLLIPLFLFYVITLILSYLAIGNITLNDVRFSICAFGISIILLYYPLNLFQGITCFYITAYLFFQQYNNGILLEDVLSTVSSNYISVLLILSISIYYIGVHNKREMIKLYDLIPAVICLLLSIWAFGRGGIMSSLILLVLVVSLYLHQPRDSRICMLFMHIITLFIIVYIIWNIVPLIDDFMSLGKWREGSDEARPAIWSSYYQKVTDSILYLFFGAPLSEISLIKVQNGNTHNSFIQLHAYNGLLFFVYFIFLLFKAVIIYFRRKEFLFLIVLITIVIRGMTDMFIFGTYGMPILLYLVLYPYMNNHIYVKKQYKSIYKV